MFLKEIWRYPVKSMRGEKLESAHVSDLGIQYDREIVVVRPDGRAITSRTHPRLLGLSGGLDREGEATVNGYRWDTAEARQLVREAVGAEADLIRVSDARRFDVLQLLVLTDGAITALGENHRRLRPNL